ncbi:MAG: DNA sulfur modification protein DndE [Anaerobacillus sp.]|uniref:DNA sulfur modification protein DndE n=1 Tax=Anaerobacillus sp. TaxID=1872506 RepID=UPI00391ACC63
MNFRLKTTKYTSDKLKQLQSTTSITPNILSRMAVSLSLNQNEVPEIPKPEAGGLEFNRNTLTGEYDFIYKAMITQHADREISDDDYFPNLFNAHLERGIRLLSNEYQHAGNYDKFLINLFDN